MPLIEHHHVHFYVVSSSSSNSFKELSTKFLVLVHHYKKIYRDFFLFAFDPVFIEWWCQKIEHKKKNGGERSNFSRSIRSALIWKFCMFKVHKKCFSWEKSYYIATAVFKYENNKFSVTKQFPYLLANKPFKITNVSAIFPLLWSLSLLFVVFLLSAFK